MIGLNYIPQSKVSMRNDKPSRTALKVAMNLLTLAAKPGMDQILPIGLIEATEKLLAACGFENSQSISPC